MLLNIGRSQLDHELLVTLLAEVTGIVNNRPITAISSDIDQPSPLTPAMLLTMKKRPLGPPPGVFVAQDLYAKQYWRRAQYLADQFWLRWRHEFLQNLQVRPKWCERQRNLSVGDVVLVKDNDVARNEWPMGKVIEALKSEDGKVRKVKVMTYKDGPKLPFVRSANLSCYYLTMAKIWRTRIAYPWARSVTYISMFLIIACITIISIIKLDTTSSLSWHRIMIVTEGPLRGATRANFFSRTCRSAIFLASRSQPVVYKTIWRNAMLGQGNFHF